MKTRLVTLLILTPAFTLNVRAGSATWNLNADGYWFDTTSWTPATIPNGPSDIATFDVSNTTSVSANADHDLELDSMVFNPGAGAFTISSPRGDAEYMNFTISGGGIINNSGILQSFVINGIDYGSARSTNILAFSNSATAGTLTQITVEGGSGDQFDGLLEFFDNSTAASSVITVYGEGALFGVGGLSFYGSSTAGNATITVYSSDCCAGTVGFAETSSAGSATFINQVGAGEVFRDFSNAASSTIIANSGGDVLFYDNSTAGDAVITINGASPGNDYAARLIMDSESSAGNATIIGNGSTVGDGAYLSLAGDGGTARVEIFGNATLHLEFHGPPGITMGSLEGDGIVSFAEREYGGTNITIGSNNLSTTFSGVITETDTPGSLTKIGTGNLTLTNANSYTGGTVINGGILLANNAVRSATGTGPVQTNAGTLGGSGTIGGAVLVGTGVGPGAFLAPGARGVTPGTLTIRKKLTLKADATYKVTLDSRASTADAVRAKGIRIQGASILFNDLGTNGLPPGTTFVIMGNAAAGPISGQFNNLADGSTLTIGSNTYQANYEGGDGNDLTLTVTP